MAGTVTWSFLLVSITDEVVDVVLGVGNTEVPIASVAFQESCKDVDGAGDALVLPDTQPFVGILPS